jgi:ABC-type multidrug transport system ATPase subunit
VNDKSIFISVLPQSVIENVFKKLSSFSIWKYLMSLSSGVKKTTILITTHYIEEAKQASAVGLMRNGKLLAEDCPSR